jgi:hypothetical protein
VSTFKVTVETDDPEALRKFAASCAVLANQLVLDVEETPRVANEADIVYLQQQMELESGQG